MRRILVAAVAIGLAAIGLPASADLTTGSPAPPYLSGTGDRFYASANKSWSGAKELTADASNNPLGKPPGEWDRDTMIWTKSCGAKAQTASFKRTLKLLGPPTISTFSIVPTFPSAAPGGMSSWSLKVNGTSAGKGTFTSPGYGASTTLSATALKAFRNGQNLIEVIVKRGALPKGQKKCNTSDANRYGVQFRLSGDFDADLALVGTSVQIPPVYRKAGTTNTSISNLSLENKGPAGVVAGGTFWVKVTGVKSVTNLSDSTSPIPGTYPAAPPFEDCEMVTTTPAPNLAVEITCTLSAMPAGMVGHLSIGTLQEFASIPTTDTSTLLQWKVSHPADSTYDNQRSAQYVWCGSQSTAPGCLALG